MSTKVAEEQEQKPAAGESSRLGISDFALLFELENVAVEGREVTYNVLSNLFSEQQTPLQPALFSRYCMDALPGEYMGTLLEALDAGKVSIGKLVEDLSSGVDMYYASNDLALKPGMEDLVNAASECGLPMCALSGLPEERARQVMERTGLTEKGVELVTYNGTEEAAPRADIWMMMAKSISKSPRRCAVLASSTSSSKAALSAGMRCVALPDRFTGFQDFGGAEMVLDSLNDVKADELLDRLFPVR
jgi:beta-phosphoglucomutase-like phosphatase (HAD superfamily)